MRVTVSVCERAQRWRRRLPSRDVFWGKRDQAQVLAHACAARGGGVCAQVMDIPFLPYIQATAACTAVMVINNVYLGSACSSISDVVRPTLLLSPSPCLPPRPSSSPPLPHTPPPCLLSPHTVHNSPAYSYHAHQFPCHTSSEKGSWSLTSCGLSSCGTRVALVSGLGFRVWGQGVVQHVRCAGLGFRV